MQVERPKDNRVVNLEFHLMQIIAGLDRAEFANGFDLSHEWTRRQLLPRDCIVGLIYSAQEGRSLLRRIRAGREGLG